jgi:LmbE family N-acetylglucosaminyl deacetylase
MLLFKRYQKLVPEKLIKNSNSEKIKLLSIFPHPDDETMAAGGLLHRCAGRDNFEVVNLCITEGEAGDEILKLTKRKLARMRKQEYKRAMEILGVKQHHMWDYPDGELQQQSNRLKKQIKKFINKEKPDIVLTYERWGIYGHPDHVYLSKIIHEISEEKESEFRMLYATMPQFIAKRIQLPKHMSEKPEDVVQTEPKYHLNIIGSGLWKKFRAARAHKSQNLMRGKRFFFWPLYAGFEYYTTEYKL